MCLRSTRRDHHTQVCNRCQKPRPENLAPREGRGKGFNERDDASDRRAPPPDEDDGYDDFGRRKKAKKSKAEREARVGRWTSNFVRRFLYCLVPTQAEALARLQGAHGPH